MTRPAIFARFVALALLTVGGCRKTATRSDKSRHKNAFVTANGLRLNDLFKSRVVGKAGLSA